MTISPWRARAATAGGSQAQTPRTDRLRHVAASACLLALGASSPVHVPANLALPEVSPPALPAFRDELVVLTRTSPTTRFLAPDGRYAGIEHDLAVHFAADLGVPLRFVEARSLTEVLSRLRRGEAHLAAAGLAPTALNRGWFRFGPGYMSVRQVIVQRRDAARLKHVRSLDARRVVVAAGSSGAEALDRAFTGRERTDADWTAADNPEDVAHPLMAGDADYAVTSSHFFDLVRTALPSLTHSLSFGHTETLAWAWPREADPGLEKAVQRFFRRIAADGTLARLIDRYYGHVRRLDATKVQAFLEAVESELPRYRADFVEAQQLTALDWRLIAALGYQESKWDPKAISPTGVQGFMMLTRETSVRLGLDNKFNARQSILAGARYLRELKDRLPERIPEPDRTWLALAAYNQGPGHLEDARVLAQRLGMNPDVWFDVRRALPRLADPEVFATLKNGYARGGEALALTENVRAYYQILVQIEDAAARTSGLRDPSLPPPHPQADAPELPPPAYL